MQVYLDSQDGLPTSFENEVIGWLPENGANPNQMFGSDPCVSLRYMRVGMGFFFNSNNKFPVFC